MTEPEKSKNRRIANLSPAITAATAVGVLGIPQTQTIGSFGLVGCSARRAPEITESSTIDRQVAGF